MPSDLNGLYVRNGGNYKGENSPHYFIGDGMLHGVWIEGGKAKRYQNRWVQTPVLGSEGPLSSLDKADNMSTTRIIYYGGRVLSLMEIGFPYDINPEFSTQGVYRLMVL